MMEVYCYEREDGEMKVIVKLGDYEELYVLNEVISFVDVSSLREWKLSVNEVIELFKKFGREVDDICSNCELCDVCDLSGKEICEKEGKKKGFRW